MDYDPVGWCDDSHDICENYCDYVDECNEEIDPGDENCLYSQKMQELNNKIKHKPNDRQIKSLDFFLSQKKRR